MAKNIHHIKRHLKRAPVKRLTPLIVFAGVFAAAGVALLTLSHAASFATSAEAENGTSGGNASTVSDSSASGGKAVKFGTATTGGGGGTCTNPIGSVQNRDTITIPGFNGQMSVRNEAWNPLHGPQTTYVCSEKSWYTMSNQTDIGGQVETYPDSLYTIGGKTINQYNSVTSTFSEAYLLQGNWDAGYDIWANDFDPNTEVMIWNEWTGAQGYWATQAKTAVTLGGVPYHFYANGTEYMFFRDTQVKSGSVDILATWKWLLSKNYLKTTDIPTDIEYGVEICGTNGNQRFDTTGFTVSVN